MRHLHLQSKLSNNQIGANHADRKAVEKWVALAEEIEKGE
jgi:hypothetical protein